MKKNVYHYVTSLPEGINEAVLSGINGYTIYTSDRLGREETAKTFNRVLRRILNNDFELRLAAGSK